MKGNIISLIPEINLIDLTHDIPPFRLAQAAFVVRNTYYRFPKGTIHLICVNSEPAKGKRHLVIEYDGHFFVCADNGIVGLICNNEEFLKSVRQYSEEYQESSFGIIDVFPKLVRGILDKNLNKITSVAEEYDKNVPMRPVIEENVISGSIIYIDTYQNAISNINKKLFEDVGKDRKFEILVQSNYYRITKINQSYYETPVGELLALFNSLDLLEIAIKDGNAADLLNLKINSVIRIKFFS